MEKNNNKKDKQIKRILLAILAVVTVFTLMFVFKDNNKQPQEDLNFDENATTIKKKTEAQLAQDTIDIPGYPNEIYITEGQTSTAIQLVNPEKNNVYFKFTISLGEFTDESFEKNEVLFESDLVKPGQIIEEQKLNRSLEKGTYDVAIEIETYSIESQKEMNGARTMTKLIVQ